MKTLNPHLASQATNSGVKFSKWGIHWVQPTLMISLYLLSVGAALSHHLFYTYLDERPAFHQERYIRIGTAISLLSRIFLASSVTVALAQRSWSTVQNKSLSLAAVDDLFMTPFGITKVFNWELLRKAKVSIALSILVFVAPVITVVTPRSLIVENSTITRSSTLPLPNIDLSRNETLLNDQDLLKIVKFEAIDYVVFKDMSGGVGSPQYDGPASRAISLIYQAAYGGEIVYGASPCGANCQYHQSFVGPSYRCFELDQYDTSAPWCVEGAKSDISCESVIDTGVDPLKTQTYEARNSSELFIDKYGGPLWTDGEDEWMDGIIWIRHRYLPLEWRGTLPDDMSYPPPSAWKNFTSRCEQWHTRFDVQRVWLDSEGGIGYNTTYLSPVKYGLVGSNYQGTPIEFEYPDIRANWANFAIHQTLYSILKGTIGVTVRGADIDLTLLDGTQLVEETPFPANRTIRKPRENLRELVQTLSYNITLSLQSVDGLVYLTPEDTLVKQWAFESIYMYNRMPLVITYATLLGAGLLAIVIGAYSFVINKMSVKPGFLLFMMTTRNRTLDELARGGSLDSEDLSKDLLKVKVKYGELVQGSLSDFGRSSGHAGFGIKGQVTDLDRRRAYD